MRILALIFSNLLLISTSIYGQKVSVGHNHHMQICDGVAYTKGNNDFGQLGIGVTGGTHPNLNQVVLPSTEYVKFINAGRFNSYMVTDTGKVWAVGANNHGQLGNGTFQDSNTPVVVVGVNGSNYLTDIIQIDSGDNTKVIALNKFGEVLEWGYNYGAPHAVSPEFVLKSNGARLSDIVKISNGSSGLYALDKDGFVWSWGIQNFGELGLGINSFYSTPRAIKILGIEEVEDISAGNYYVVALKKDGTVWAWGRNSYGSCGLGYFSNKVSIPSQVVSISGQGFLTGIREIGATAVTTFAVDSSGQVIGWGNNTTGALGNAQVITTNLPVSVTGLNGQGTLVDVSEFDGNSVITTARMANCEYLYMGWPQYAGFNYNVQTQNIPRHIDFSELPCCEGWGDIEVVTPTAYTICEGGCIDIEASLYYGEANVNWSLPGSTISTATGMSVPNICYNTPGTYIATAYENSGNPSSVAIQITVLPATSRPCQVRSVLDNEISIYPNPSHGIFLVSLTNSQESVSYVLKNIFGKIIEHGNLQTSNFEIQLTNEPQGIYFLEVKTVTATEVYKLIKK